MNARLAALVALLFAAAVATPELGLVVHRHAGGDHLHIHAGPGERPRHAHDAPVVHDDHHAHHDHAANHEPHDGPAAHDRVADHDHAHDHEHVADHAHSDEPSTGPALSVAGDGWAWHTHWTQPFHRAARAARAALAPPQPVARLTPDAPRERVAASPPAGRSRAPPRIEPT